MSDEREIIRKNEVGTAEGFMVLGGNRTAFLESDALTIECYPETIVHVRENSTGVIIYVIDGTAAIKTKDLIPVMITTPASKICGVISGEVTVASTEDSESVTNNTESKLILYDDIREKTITQPSYSLYDFFTETTAEL